MLQDEENPRACACVARQSDLMHVPPTKKDWLRKTTCPRCRKVYRTDKDTDYCMDCQSSTIALPCKSDSS